MWLILGSIKVLLYDDLFSCCLLRCLLCGVCCALFIILHTTIPQTTITLFMGVSVTSYIHILYQVLKREHKIEERELFDVS